MNYCDKIHYHIYTTKPADFEEMADSLLTQLPKDKQIFRLAFFGMPIDNEQYVSRHTLLRTKIRKYYGNNEPVLSYVSQPPLNGALTLEAHCYVPNKEDIITYQHIEDLSYVLLENENGRFLFAGGFHSNVTNFNIEQQSSEIFHTINRLMEKERFPINSIIRQWNYIERIIEFNGEDQHYQIFNNARSLFYSKTNWENGYPAATGIGTNLGGILVDLDAVVFSNQNCYATPIDNKLQIAAHAYSKDVLEVAGSRKTTPKFERAKSMTFGDRKLIYISGTAAIRGEESLIGVGLEQQLHITMENINQLIGDAKPIMLRVYLKHKSYYEETHRLLNAYNLKIPVSYMWADVCRNELLIEIEGIAIL